MQEQGKISIHTENIFPIIKKFLYSDQEVFLRELVANAVDATQKLHHLATMGKYDGNIDKGEIVITTNEKLNTITISDQGIGMTGDEVKKYINQIAFSGATAFVEKYKNNNNLIGCFGLGFYSAFMVAHKVEIHTLSYQKEATPVRWSCDGSTQFTLENTVKKNVGTDIVLHLTADAKEYIEKHKIQSILDKYCKFLPSPIVFDGKTINDTQPLWIKLPNAVTKEEYLSFYKKLYPLQFQEPLFWVHLNVDYPFKLTGILYFPQMNNDFEPKKGKIQLYAKQVFITSEVEHIVPEFLMLMHGAIDSPDIPLNVSRSFLQADSNVKKINTYITKKVAEKLYATFQKERNLYENKWSSIGTLIKYGCITQEPFYTKMQPAILLKSIDNKYYTVNEYIEKVKPQQTDKDQNTIIIYATHATKQDIYIKRCQEKNYDVVVLDHLIDQHFINYLEQKIDKVKFKNVDSSTPNLLIEKNNTTQQSVLKKDEEQKIKTLFEQTIGNTKNNYVITALDEKDLPLMLNLSEEMQRIQHISVEKGNLMENPENIPYTVTINANHPIIKKVITITTEEQKNTIQHLYDLALLTQSKLQGNALTQFVGRSIAWMDKN